MAWLLQPTEPRPPAAQPASLELGLLLVRSWFALGSLMVRSWFARVSLMVRRKFALSTVAVRYCYGAVLFLSGTVYRLSTVSFHDSAQRDYLC